MSPVKVRIETNARFVGIGWCDLDSPYWVCACLDTHARLHVCGRRADVMMRGCLPACPEGRILMSFVTR